MHRAIRLCGILVATLTLAAAAPGITAQDGWKIGVFDPQRVSEETTEGKRIQALLTDVRQQRQNEIEQETNRIAELQQQLEQQGLSLSEERRTTLEIDIQRRLLELNSRKDIATRGFQLEIAAAEARFNEKLRSVINEFARSQGFTLIFEAGAVAFASPQVDITTAIIDLFDRMYPEKEGGQ